MHEDLGDRMGCDHLMRTGDGECDTYLPRGQFNADMPRDASYYCKTCVRGAACLDADQGGVPVDLADLVDVDDLMGWLGDDDDDDPDAETARRRRGVYPLGSL